MTVVKRFAKSRTSDRTDGLAFSRYKKRMPPASLGFTEELRLYSLDLLKRASVKDAVEVVQQEVDQLERLYLESVGTEPGGDGTCARTHATDQRKVANLADRVAVARVLLRHLPSSPQAMSRGSFATWGSEGHAMVAALCVAVMLTLLAACQRHCRKVICRCPRFVSAGAFGSQANRRRNSSVGGHTEQPAKPACSDANEPKSSPSQLQQRRSRKTKAVPSDPLGAASAVVGNAESTGAVQTLGAAGDFKHGKKHKASQTVQETPESTPIAQPKRQKAKNVRPPSPQKATPAINATSQEAATPQKAATPAQPARPPAQQLVQDRQQPAVRQVAQPEAEPEQEQREEQLQGIRVERRVPQAQEVNSAVSEDLRAIAGRKRQLSQPVSDVSEISSVDGDTASSAGSDAGSVSGQSGSSYGPISPSFVLHHAQQHMSWAQRLRSGMSARAAGMDTSDSDTNSISSLDDSYSFRSEASCRRRLSTVCSVNNADCEETEDADGWRGGRARSRPMRPTYSTEVTSSDSESDQDLAARRARACVSSRAKKACMSAKVAAGSTCHCIDEVWDGRLPEGVMAEKLQAADGGVLGRSAALGTIPFELRHPARHYRGLRPYSSWDAVSGPTLSSVMEAEALTTPARPQDAVPATAAVLTRAKSVDETCSLGLQSRTAPVVAPLPFALRASTAGEAAVEVSPPGGSSPNTTTAPLDGDHAVRRSNSRERAGAAAILAMIGGRKDEDSVTGGSGSSVTALPAPVSLAPVKHQFVHVPVAIPVHMPMVPCQWPMGEQRPHATAAEHRLACRRAIEKQMLFYFSAENMSRDAFLRSNMDADGFVSLGEYSSAAVHQKQIQIRIGCSALAWWLVRP